MAGDRYQNYVWQVIGWRVDEASANATFQRVSSSARQMGQAVSREFQRGMSGASAAIGRVADEFGRMAFRYTYYAMIIGRLSQYVLGRLMTRPFYQAAQEMDSARAQLRVLTEDTAKYIDLLTQAAQQLALVLPETATDIVQGFTAALRAGRPLSELRDLIESASSLRLISKQALRTEVEYMSLLRAAYPGYTPGRLGDIMAKAATMSVFGVAELEDAVRRGLSTMASLGMAFESGVAQILSFAQVGVEPTRAGTMLRRLTMRELQPRIRQWSASAFSYLRSWAYRLADETGEYFQRLVEGLGGDIERARAIVREIQNMPQVPDYTRPGETTYWTATAAQIAQILEPERYYQRIRPGLTEIWGVREVEPFLAVAGFRYKTPTGEILRGIEAFRYLEQTLRDSEGALKRVIAEYRKSYEWAEAQARATSQAFKQTLGLPMLENVRIFKLAQTAIVGALVGLITGSDKLMDRWQELGGTMEALKQAVQDSSSRLGQFRAAMIATTIQVTGIFMKILGLLGLAASTFGLIGVKAMDVAEQMIAEGTIPLLGAIPGEILARARRTVILPGGRRVTQGQWSPLYVIWRALLAKAASPFKTITAIFTSILALAWIWHANLGRIRSRMDNLVGRLEGVTDIVKTIADTVRGFFYPLTSLLSGLRVGFNAALNLFAWGLRGAIEIFTLLGKALRAMWESPFGRAVRFIVSFPLKMFGGVAGFFTGLAFIFWMLERWGRAIATVKRWYAGSRIARWVKNLTDILSVEGWEGLGKRAGSRIDRMFGRLLGWNLRRFGKGLNALIMNLQFYIGLVLGAFKEQGLVGGIKTALSVLLNAAWSFSSALGRYIAQLASPLTAFIRGLFTSSVILQKLAEFLKSQIMWRAVGWLAGTRLGKWVATLLGSLLGRGRGGGTITTTAGLLGLIAGQPFRGWGMEILWGEFIWGLKETASILKGGLISALQRFRDWLATIVASRWFPMPSLGRGKGGGGPTPVPVGPFGRVWDWVKRGASWVWSKIKTGGAWLWNTILAPAGKWVLGRLGGALGGALGGTLGTIGTVVGGLGLAAAAGYGIYRWASSRADIEAARRRELLGQLSPEQLKTYYQISRIYGEAMAMGWAEKALAQGAAPTQQQTTLHIDYHPILQVPEGTTKEQAQALLDDVLALIQQHLRQAQVEALLNEQRSPGLVPVNP